jgi:hypothetical protein
MFEDTDLRLLGGLGGGVILAVLLTGVIPIGLLPLIPLVTAYLVCKGWTWTVIDDGKRKKRKVA